MTAASTDRSVKRRMKLKLSADIVAVFPRKEHGLARVLQRRRG
jgi:hypothetical protein